MAEFKVGDRVCTLDWGNGTVKKILDSSLMCTYPIYVVFDTLPMLTKSFTPEGTYSKYNIDTKQTIYKILRTKKMIEQKEDKTNPGMTHKTFMEALLRGDTLQDGDCEWVLDSATGDLLMKGFGNVSGIGYPNNLLDITIKPKTININGFIVPEPERKPLERDTEYFLADTSGRDRSHSWENVSYDRLWLEAGLVHLTKEAADLHIKALHSFTKI